MILKNQLKLLEGFPEVEIVGTALSRVPGDLGAQGEPPANGPLLDWLACEFMDRGWDVKQLVRTIVTSATYRQASTAGAAQLAADPENREFARQGRFRIEAELVRDYALEVAGLLSPRIGGPSIKPYQPDGVWEINSAQYVPDSSNALYRRSLYVLVKRSVHNPTLATFDAPSRSYCISRRQRTNTPLQALVMLNDPTFLETARVLGEQMCTVSDPAQAIIQTYRRLTGRTPSSKEVELLVSLQKTEYEKFKAHPDKQKGWLKAGLFAPASHAEPAQVAANAVVASTILNSDAFITKR